MPLYVGFDCSTQSLSAVVVDSERRVVVHRDSFPLDEPWIPSGDPSIVHTSPRTWAAALVTSLEGIARNLDTRSLRAISGSAQQHGSVYCGDAPNILTRTTSPIWMDNSTSAECQEIEHALGGPAAVASLTGSRVYPRFTGPQIRKFAREEPDAYARTTRIHLVSSYLLSILGGRHMPIDHADGSGMNLMDIRTRTWSPTALEATAPDLARRLPPLVRSSTLVGSLDPALCARLELPPVRLVAWSGDNPSSLVGTGLLNEGQLAISLGTSDTIFGPMNEPRVSADGTGHVFASPLGAYMGITVFRNGSLARQHVRDDLGIDWNQFSYALQVTPAGNNGAMMLPWFEPEITPDVARPGVHRFGLENASPAQHVRAVVEAQAMALAGHSNWMGVVPRTIYATGGAAENREILQVIADVFDAEVYRFESTDSAALGAALRAFQVDSRLPWPDVIDGFVAPVAASRVAPIPAHVDRYRRLRPVYAAREAQALGRPAGGE